jgi:hypothetical protein
MVGARPVLSAAPKADMATKATVFGLHCFCNCCYGLMLFCVWVLVSYPVVVIYLSGVLDSSPGRRGPVLFRRLRCMHLLLRFQAN